MLKDDITLLAKAAVAAVAPDQAEHVTLTHPIEESHGDFSVTAAFALAKELGQGPLEVAETLAEHIRGEHSPLVAEVAAVAPGFVNIYLTPKALGETLKDIRAQGAAFGTVATKANKRIVVEYSSPNIAKPFSIGHLRSTVIGDALANVLEAVGWRVFRDNHVGDWGTQFGKEIYAIKTWGDEAAIKAAERPVKELLALYVRFHEAAEKDPTLEDEARAWSKKLEDKDPEARRLWQKCVDWSWREFAAIYERLGVRFTENNGRGYGEAFFEDKIAPVIADLKEKNLLTKGEGAQLVFFAKETKLPPLMIIRQDGATLYATRDLATDKFRREHYGPDVVILNETGVEQGLYFRQLFATEVLLGWYKDNQRLHVKHGHWRFKDRKMATRTGDIIWLEDVIAEAVKRAGEIISESGTAKSLTTAEQQALAEMVGIGALKWNDLKNSPHIDIVFDWQEVLNMQGNASPYVQYTHARARSIVADAGQWQTPESVPGTLTPDELSVLRLLYRYPETVNNAAERHALNGLCLYLYELAQRFNRFYQHCPVLRAPSAESKAFRLELTAASAQVIKNGLGLLGIEAPERM